MVNEAEVSVFIKLKNESVAKLLHFTKPKQKSKLFYEALIYFVANNSKEVKEFANPLFKNEFEEILEDVKEERRKKCGCWDYWEDKEC
jgi:hypothetical protein